METIIISILSILLGITSTFTFLYFKKPRRKEKEEKSLLNDKEQRMREHFDALANYSTDQAYKRGELDV